MHNLSLFADKTENYSILCLGAHGDDIEIGCGGTILRLLKEYPNISLRWIILSCGSKAQRKREIRASANAFLQNAKKKIEILEFRDGYLPFLGAGVKDYFEQLKRKCKPDLIFTHYRDDLHQDHRLISNLTWNTFRNHLIWEYEVPKYDGGLGSPNLFVPLNRVICNRKVDNLLKYFETQKTKHWFTRDVFLSMLRIRGLECHSPSKYAEAFYSHKLSI